MELKVHVDPCVYFPISNLRFLMIALAYAVPTGVIAGWSGVLDMILTPANVSQVGKNAHVHVHVQTAARFPSSLHLPALPDHQHFDRTFCCSELKLENTLKSSC